MREIKFRAINAKNELIYGLPYTDGVNDTVYYKDFNNRLCWRNEEGSSCNQPYKNGTLMQYTGLKDKNGKEIYEGDIVKLCDNNNGFFRVEFKNQYVGGWVLTYKKESDLSLGARKTKDLEVIGNIYKNPELLDKGKEHE